MNLLIFGASGATGQELVNQALKKGFFVTAFVRNPSGFSIRHGNLKIAQGDVSNFTDVNNVLKTKFDGVICALGAKSPIKRDLKLIEGVKNIVTAMEKNSIERLIYLSFIGVREKKSDLGFLYNFVIPIVMRNVIIDHKLKEDVIVSSNLNWTIVQPPKLTFGSYTGKYKSNEEIIKDKANKLTLSRANLADFMLTQVDNNLSFKKKLFVTE